MMARALYLVPVVALLSAATCTAWRDETKGMATVATTTYPTTSNGGSSGSGGSGGSGGSAAGGGGPCMTCQAFFTASSTCVAPNCPGMDQVCSGAAADALSAFGDCMFCDACPSQCPGMCGSSSISGLSPTCQGCVVGALSGACAAQFGACQQS